MGDMSNNFNMALRILVFDATLGFHRELETSETSLGLKALCASIDSGIHSIFDINSRVLVFDHAQRRLRSMEINESVIGFSAAEGEPDSPYPLFGFRTIDAHFKELIKTKWREVKEPYTGCTVAVSTRTLHDGTTPVDHVGIYVHPNMFISTSDSLQFSQIIPLDKYNVIGFYEFIGES